jgi:hypothetical protein
MTGNMAFHLRDARETDIPALICYDGSNARALVAFCSARRRNAGGDGAGCGLPNTRLQPTAAAVIMSHRG